MNRPRDTNAPRGSRAGFTFTEILVTMTVASVAMTTAASLLHRALRLEVASRRVLERERAALALARQFRADVHRASAVACAADVLPAGVVLRATTVAGTIDYTAAAAGLIRTESRGGRAVRETFASLPGTRWWAVREGRMVTLRADGASDTAAAPPPAVEVVAVVGGAAGEPDPEALP